MQTRGQFDQELKEIDQEIVELANLTEKALANAVRALFNQDIGLAEQVIEADKVIDKKDLEINDKVVLLIAKQNPVATDLRRLITAIKIVADLERMADNARNIARSTIRLGENKEVLIPNRLNTMQETLVNMLHTAITAFTEEDDKLAAQLSEMDDAVDRENKLILSELLGETATNPDKIQYIMQISLCSRYLERFGDHITNIGESILYLIKGENYNLN
ncbi:phosphate transport system regulatory protein PhoU [Virgibacillus pantothenticus]|uniref:phosphate signaling complex protein PhoU n=1 Tax=Virgibacillus pantothenticus TaxID=1473 RepID=UPI001B19AAD3|nr:phosphate signaling complex protein PhoU [Virgibacillus pantothenticus]MBU8565532.1 phosphate signaling complex protein PhoU [Virgibacillus pantothenticus]MBU8599832.1 phosphate signaling complex protein PhoU [Virgibacillus pantothenticus]MBU8634279.1 phosphate signaling complex protein PhoU [Virgibacillus pantothenticus]MBU8641573.1 phosphate signaling complex protein PhoU [Virgibacillus pantothenticus]MBU8647885.1 phosphate signaling complex protein PhoU [Virgibacillus pantothenticus]